MPTTFDIKRRQTLKLFTGIAASGATVSLPAFADHLKKNSATASGDIIDGVLISRADASRNYLLMHNNTAHEVAVMRFSEQIVHFENTVVNMADAFVEPLIIPPKDRVMARLTIDTVDPALTTHTRIINKDREIKHLSQGTRVIELKLGVDNGVAEILTQPLIV